MSMDGYHYNVAIVHSAIAYLLGRSLHFGTFIIIIIIIIIILLAQYKECE